MLERIIFLCLYPPELDGSAFSNAEFVQGLAGRGFTIEVIAQPCKGDAEYDQWTSQEHGVIVHRVPVQIPYEGKPPSQTQLREIWGFIEQTLAGRNGNMPEIGVIGHDSWAWYEPLLHGFGLPVVQHLRGTPTRAIMHNIYPPDATTEYLERVMSADQIVALGHHFERLMLELGYPSDRVSTIHNGVDVDHFYPRNGWNGELTLMRQHDIPEDAVVVVHASNHYPVKRITDIVESAHFVIRQHPKVIYLIIGEGPESDRVRSAVDESPYSANFRLVGRVAYADMPNYLRIGRIFVLSSESEGFSRATVEAQACGLYLIMSDMPAGLERTGNGIRGTNYRVGDAQDLARKTLDVLDMDAGEFARITKAGRDFVVTNCSYDVQLDRYERLLRTIAKRV